MTEFEERCHRVAEAIASGRLEGLEPSPAAITDAREFMDGTLSADEFIERGQRLWGLA